MGYQVIRVIRDYLELRANKVFPAILVPLAFLELEVLKEMKENEVQSVIRVIKVIEG